MNRVLKRLSAIALICCLLAGIIPSLTLETEASSGTFTAVAMNVDGLPNKIFGISINSDGPGSDGTTAMSQKIATYGWDLIGVAEDFNYHTELMSSLSSDYSSGTSRGGVSGLSNDTDGLNLIWKNNITVTGEAWVGWEENYASGLFGTGNGADTMIDKGYRFYQAAIADGVTVDVYVLHMDADSDAEDIAAREAQLTQLATAIKSSNNGNPILVIGDTNCRYTRENLKTLFIDTINADSRFTIQDTWIENIRNNDYPVYGSDALVAVDKGGTYEYPQAEVVDKIFYINNADSDVTLTLNSHTVVTDFVDSSGTALADHWPIVAEFSYAINTETPVVCEHSYQVLDSKEATCTAAGYITYTCSKCNDSYTENVSATGHTEITDSAVNPTCIESGLTEGSHCSVCNVTLTEQTVVAALGHDYVEGVCSRCGEAEPECEHVYQESSRIEASCTEDGVITYTCSKCEESYIEDIEATGHTEIIDNAVNSTCTESGLTEGSHCSICNVTLTEQTVVAALGHDYVDGVCSRCNESDPSYQPDNPETEILLGALTTELADEGCYVLTFSGTTGVFALERDSDGTIIPTKIDGKQGDVVTESQIWNVKKVDGGYTISIVVDGNEYYLYRTKSFVGYGYKVALRADSPYVWKTKVDTANGSIRFYEETTYGSKYYLRYYNARLGWIATTRAAGIKVYQVNE